VRSEEGIHELGVVTDAGPPGDTVSFAWCSCGWTGPSRKWRDEATDDALNHPADLRDPAESLPP
jgi:hypothetical protein